MSCHDFRRDTAGGLEAQLKNTIAYTLEAPLSVRRVTTFVVTPQKAWKLNPRIHLHSNRKIQTLVLTVVSRLSS